MRQYVKKFIVTVSETSKKIQRIKRRTVESTGFSFFFFTFVLEESL